MPVARRAFLTALALLPLAACDSGKSSTQIAFSVDRDAMIALSERPMAEIEEQLAQLFLGKLAAAGRGSSAEDKAAMATLAGQAAAWLTSDATTAALAGDEPVEWTGKGEADDMVFTLTMTM